MIGTATGRIQQFDQGQLLDQLIRDKYGNSAVETVEKQAICEGICYMLSIEWLRQLLDNVTTLPENVYHYPAASDAELYYYKQIANNFVQYINDVTLADEGRTIFEFGGAADWLNFTDDTWHQHYVELCSRSAYTVIGQAETFDKNTADITKAVESAVESAFLLVLYVPAHIEDGKTKDGFGHALALYKKGGKYYVFDPNFGVYVFDTPNTIAAEIFMCYAPWYTDPAQTVSPELQVFKIG